MGELLWRGQQGGVLGRNGAGAVLSGKEFFQRFAVKISGSLCLGA